MITLEKLIALENRVRDLEDQLFKLNSQNGLNIRTFQGRIFKKPQKDNNSEELASSK